MLGGTISIRRSHFLRLFLSRMKGRQRRRGGGGRGGWVRIRNDDVDVAGLYNFPLCVGIHRSAGAAV